MYLKHKLAVITISLLILIIALLIFFLNIANISFIKSYTQFDSEVVSGNIQIYRDYYGIPFIKLEYDKDFYYAMGYEHAASRLWQMDYTRRIAQGKLSEIFGKRTLSVDKFFRALELDEIADSLYANLHPKSIQILNDYSKGVNDYIAKNKKRLSFEFGTLNYEPKKWEPKHSLMIGRAMAFEMSLSFWIESAYADIANKYSLEFAQEYIPGYDENAPFITSKIISSYNKTLFNKQESDTSKLSSLFEDLSHNLIHIREELGLEGSGTGSNSWVANKFFSDSLGAILANDPHLSLSLPARWAFMQIESPNYHVLGFSIPGVPSFAIGRNHDISWGITNIMADICDFYVERLDSSKKSYYSESLQLEKIILEKDTIKIKDEIDYYYYKRKTKRSNIISELHLFNSESNFLDLEQQQNKSDFYSKYQVTFEWAAKYNSDEILASHKLIKSQNFKEFRSALSTWGFPALNFSYGDKSGNIGIVPTGYIPEREELCDPNLPNPSWEPNKSWKGVFKNKLPYIYNPERNFVFSANNKTSKDLKFHISNHWEPDSRAKRIEEMLEITEKYSVRDAQIMQSDVLSPYARDLCEISIPILESLKKIMSDREKKALEIIKDWDYIISPIGSASAIYNYYFERLIYNTFYDELGERIYREYTFVANVPTRKLMELLKSGNHILFDDINTDEVENMNFVIYKSFNESLRELRDIFESTDMNDWNWGELHMLNLKHPFSENPFLAPSVTMNPLSIGGNNTTINNTEYKIYKPFEVVLGASMRFIADLNDSIVHFTLPGGISGDPINPNYSNQVQLWYNGGYIKTTYSNFPGEEYNLIIEINPEN